MTNPTSRSERGGSESAKAALAGPLTEAAFASGRLRPLVEGITNVRSGTLVRCETDVDKSSTFPEVFDVRRVGVRRRQQPRCLHHFIPDSRGCSLVRVE